MNWEDCYSLFEGASSAEIGEAQALFHTLDLPYGEALLSAGEENEALVYVVSGELAVKSLDYEVAQVFADEVVGMMGVFVEPLMLTDVRVIKSSALIVVEKADLMMLVKAGNPVAANIERLVLETLTRRIRVCEEQIARLIGAGPPDPKAKPVPNLFEQFASWLPTAASERPGPSIDVVGLMKSSPLFEDARPDALRALAKWWSLHEVADGEPLFAPRQQPRYLFLVARGAAELHITPWDDPVPLRRVERGSLLGVSHGVDGHARTALALASGDTVVARMAVADWLELYRDNTHAGRVIRWAAIRSLLEKLALLETTLFQSWNQHRESVRDEVQALYPRPGKRGRSEG